MVTVSNAAAVFQILFGQSWKPVLQLIDVVFQFFLDGFGRAFIDAYGKGLDLPEVGVYFIFFELCHDFLVCLDVIDDFFESGCVVRAAGGLDHIEQSSAEGHGMLS